MMKKLILFIALLSYAAPSQAGLVKRVFNVFKSSNEDFDPKEDARISQTDTHIEVELNPKFFGGDDFTKHARARVIQAATNRLYVIANDGLADELPEISFPEDSRVAIGRNEVGKGPIDQQGEQEPGSVPTQAQFEQILKKGTFTVNQGTKNQRTYEFHPLFIKGSEAIKASIKKAQGKGHYHIVVEFPQTWLPKYRKQMGPNFSAGVAKFVGGLGDLASLLISFSEERRSKSDEEILAEVEEQAIENMLISAPQEDHDFDLRLTEPQFAEAIVEQVDSIIRTQKALAEALQDDRKAAILEFIETTHPDADRETKARLVAQRLADQLHEDISEALITSKALDAIVVDIKDKDGKPTGDVMTATGIGKVLADQAQAMRILAKRETAFEAQRNEAVLNEVEALKAQHPDRAGNAEFDEWFLTKARERMKNFYSEMVDEFLEGCFTALIDSGLNQQAQMFRLQYEFMTGDAAASHIKEASGQMQEKRTFYWPRPIWFSSNWEITQDQKGKFSLESKTNYGMVKSDTPAWRYLNLLHRTAMFFKGSIYAVWKLNFINGPFGIKSIIGNPGKDFKYSAGEYVHPDTGRILPRGYDIDPGMSHPVPEGWRRHPDTGELAPRGKWWTWHTFEEDDDAYLLSDDPRKESWTSSMIHDFRHGSERISQQRGGSVVPAWFKKSAAALWYYGGRGIVWNYGVKLPIRLGLTTLNAAFSGAYVLVGSAPLSAAGSLAVSASNLLAYDTEDPDSPGQDLGQKLTGSAVAWGGAAASAGAGWLTSKFLLPWIFNVDHSVFSWAAASSAFLGAHIAERSHNRSDSAYYPALKALVMKSGLHGVGQIGLSLLRFIAYDLGVGVLWNYVGNPVVNGGRWVRDRFVFHTLIKPVMPASLLLPGMKIMKVGEREKFLWFDLYNQIEGTGVSSDYFVSITSTQALVALQAQMELTLLRTFQRANEVRLAHNMQGAMADFSAATKRETSVLASTPVDPEDSSRGTMDFSSSLLIPMIEESQSNLKQIEELTKGSREILRKVLRISESGNIKMSEQDLRVAIAVGIENAKRTFGPLLESLSREEEKAFWAAELGSQSPKGDWESLVKKQLAEALGPQVLYSFEQSDKKIVVSRVSSDFAEFADSVLFDTDLSDIGEATAEVTLDRDTNSLPNYGPATKAITDAQKLCQPLLVEGLDLKRLGAL